ncbi:MAG TPA: ribonuclease P protein component [Candidatus Saccharimonadales bacterium]|nr:ribonuclease P protein component [Candidatus Saccharimonadales bacterium]
MLARPRRLRSSRDINRVYKTGRFGGAENLSVKSLDRHRADSRAVVVVGKKVSKKAVDRNKIRRQLSELLAKDWQQIKVGCDIVVTVKTSTLTLTVTQLEAQLKRALTKAGASRGNNV